MFNCKGFFINQKLLWLFGHYFVRNRKFHEFLHSHLGEKKVSVPVSENMEANKNDKRGGNKRLLHASDKGR